MRLCCRAIGVRLGTAGQTALTGALSFPARIAAWKGDLMITRSTLMGWCHQVCSAPRIVASTTILGFCFGETIMADMRAIPPKPFTTDGCSGGMSWLWLTFTGELPPWEHMCVLHDQAYWRGGTRHARYRADVLLRDRLIVAGHRNWAWLIYWSVRVGGHPWLPTSWRWGYGWPYPRRGP